MGVNKMSYEAAFRLVKIYVTGNSSYVRKRLQNVNKTTILEFARILTDQGLDGIRLTLRLLKK